MYEKEKELFAEMMDIITKLRGPKGCLWDRKQTLESLVPNILEEAEEVYHYLTLCSSSYTGQ